MWNVDWRLLRTSTECGVVIADERQRALRFLGARLLVTAQRPLDARSGTVRLLLR